MASLPSSCANQLSEDLVNLRVSESLHPTSPTMPSEESKDGMTLETLPLEIKHEIFSNFLLGEKVKYSTNGRYPGHKYKFDTAIMRTSKQMNKDASAYLRSHNEFVLLHVKFFALEIDRRNFIPTVAAGKVARSFRDPAVEATITHLGTACTCPFMCPKRKHFAKDRITHALILSENLVHFTRELRLAYHVWPAYPIYLHSKPNVLPIQYIPVNVETKVKVVWKINPSYRQDLNDKERRARQIKLLEPFKKPMSHGQTVTVLGADDDLASQVTGLIYPRLLPVDAVGWDLLELVRDQKSHLDILVDQGSTNFSDLCWAYVDLLDIAWDFGPHVNERSSTASVMRAISNDIESTCLAFWSLQSLDEDDYESAIEGSWQPALVATVFDCFFTVMRLSVEHNLPSFLQRSLNAFHSILTGGTIRPNLVPLKYVDLFKHYCGLFRLWSSSENPRGRSTEEIYQDAAEVFSQALEAIGDELGDGMEYIMEDFEFMSSVAEGKVKPSGKPFSDCKGLLRHPRVNNTPMTINWPEEDKSTKQQFPDAKRAKSIIQFADAFCKENKTPLRAEEIELGHDCVALIDAPSDGPVFAGVISMPMLMPMPMPPASST